MCRKNGQRTRIKLDTNGMYLIYEQTPDNPKCRKIETVPCLAPNMENGG